MRAVCDDTAESYALRVPTVYRDLTAGLFHAERTSRARRSTDACPASNTPSVCEPRCGGREPGCKLGPRCGDRIVQAGEDYDDGNPVDGGGCGSACRNLVLGAEPAPEARPGSDRPTALR